MAVDANNVAINVGDHVLVSATIMIIENDDLSLNLDQTSSLILHTDTGVVGTTLWVAATSVVKS